MRRAAKYLYWRGVEIDLIVPRLLMSLPLIYSWRTAALNRIGCDLHPTARIEAGARLIGRNLSMGEGAYVNSGVLLDTSRRPITLGARVHVGPRAMLLTDGHDVGRGDQRAGEWTHKPVAVGDGAWVGAGAIVLPGVTVAPGCVIAAGAVVARDTEPHGLYAGVPATRVRDLTP